MKIGATEMPGQTTHPLRAAAFALLAAFAAGFLAATQAAAQVHDVRVAKRIVYQQTSDTTVALRPVSTPCSGCPYVFIARVRGENIQSIAAPTVAGPFVLAGIGSYFNNGRLVYNTSDNQWKFGATGSNWSSPTLANLNSLFPNGTYSFLVSGATVSMTLAGDAYPNVPVLKFSQGTWRNGKLEFDPGKPLTITTNAYAAYGANANDVIYIGIARVGDFAQARNRVSGWDPSTPVNTVTYGASNTFSFTLPANTAVSGQEYPGYGGFNAIVDGNTSDALPGSYNVALYSVETGFTLKAVAEPVFPMTVTSNITATTASATAAIQFRPQDLGTSASIYTFAVAPANLVKGGFEAKAQQVGTAWSEKKADAPTCVVAQINASGELIAVTTGQLQAFTSGTLSANGASVTILNNASTPAVAGATFYVGYGSSSTTMVQNGVYRPAVTVPGTSVCPMLSSQTALWWNPAENGWGVNFAHQGNILFGTLYTYDAAGAPLWLMMSNGAMQSDGASFTGDLYRTTGPAFNANPFTPITPANLTKVGTMTASFTDVNSGTLKYTVNGVEVNKGIQRLVYGTRAASCLPSTASRATSTNYQDLWWNAAESGWGVNVTHQDNTLFATLFNYDATGKGLWLVMSGGVRQADGSYLGTLYRSSGPAFNASPFTPITEANLTNVGTMRFTFADGERGTLSYTVNGTAVTKAITRLAFSSPVPLCN